MGRGPGIQTADPLDQIKVLLVDKGIMGVGHAHPLGGRAQLQLLDLVIACPALALHQRSRVDFIPENTENGSSGPFAICPVRITVFAIRKTVVALIGQRGGDPQVVQLVCDMQGAGCIT